MCGINGIVSLDGAPIDAAETRAITRAMARRGPDGEGFLDLGRAQLGHRRLAIIDLTDASAQPLPSVDGRYAIAFNGEIYNHHALREELAARGSKFASSGDTEVILEAYRHFGEGCVGRLRGMFAFAIWDRKEQSLFLARDPLGIKPLCIAVTDEHLRFASSARALLLSRAVDARIDDTALAAYLAWGHLPEPATLFRGVRMLAAGSTLSVRGGVVKAPRRYWRVADLWRTPPQAYSPQIFREELLATVSAHLVGDVRVGTFLSAGIDSTALLGLATEVQGRAQTAITLGFDEFEGTAADEVPLASAVAARYGAEHHIARITLNDAESLIPEFLDAMDSPSTDGLNSFHVARATRALGLKCAMSGMGGDELFGGYRVMHRFARLHALRPRVPSGAWRLAAGVAANGAGWRRDKMLHLAEAMRSPEALYQLLRGVRTPQEVARRMGPDRFNAAGGLDAILEPVRIVWTGAPAHAWIRVVTAEFALYLRNQLLRDSDWASMWHGVELRVPFVDRVFLEQCAAPIVAREGMGGKRSLAAAPSPALPSSVVNRPKTGFSLPMSPWTVRALRAGILQMPAFLAEGDVPTETRRLANLVEQGQLHWSRAWSLTVLDRYTQPRIAES